MLNKDGNRELAYVVIIDDISPIKGYDRVELAHVGGWTIVVGKGEFKPGDPAIYFEIDSQLPEVEPFTNMEFLAKKHYKIKTQRMCKSLSQGLLMSAKNFGWTIESAQFAGGLVYIKDNNGTPHFPGDDESRFLTKQLGVTYNDPVDNTRKAPSADKYKKMAQRHPELFKKKPIRWLYKREWGKKLLFLLFGKKKDKKNAWPDWVVKTDEERIENMLWRLKDKAPWTATEKIDGTSTTFTIKRGKRNKHNFYVCSRNVVMDTPDRKNFYSEIAGNVYWEMAVKYNIEEVLTNMLNDFPEAEWITIQGETFGSNIQKRNYNMEEHDFKAFNLVMSNTGKWETKKMTEVLSSYNIPCVPTVNEQYVLPDTIEELRDYVDSESSTIDGEIREGIVFRRVKKVTINEVENTVIESFKCVSPNYLLKYHN